jgi:site-specific recombinase XerD
MANLNDNQKQVSPLREQMTREMQLQRLSPLTIKSYLSSVTRLARHYRRSPDLLSIEEVRAYVRHLIIDQKLAASTINCRICAFRFLYSRVLKREGFVLKARCKRSGRLPQPLSRAEVTRLLQAAVDRKHRMMLMTEYSGHSNLSTTAVYLHVTNRHLRDIKSPLDLLPEPEHSENRPEGAAP